MNLGQHALWRLRSSWRWHFFWLSISQWILRVSTGHEWFPLSTTRLARRARIYRGVQAAVASELGLSRAHVSLVCRGLRRSRKVEAALASAVVRIQKEAA